MTQILRAAGALFVALIFASAIVPANAREHRISHPPIHVATPRGNSPITPYFFPYGAGYRYNSPGPVFARLYDWDAENCRVWRYNYLYWACD